MSLRLGICFLMIAAVHEVFGQRDSVLLKPVVIYGLTDSLFLTGSTVESLDARLKQQQNSQHLGEILSFQFPIYFRNYGNGMISGISMRGTSPQHVAVRWNGININSVRQIFHCCRRRHSTTSKYIRAVVARGSAAEQSEAQFF
jgi:vitamin B12 transporter